MRRRVCYIYNKRLFFYYRGHLMVKLSDIAKELNLSLSVVSRALSADPDKHAIVKKETAEKIRAYARQVGYQPNRQASFLGKGRCATIFCFLPDTPTRLTNDLMFGIAETAREENFPVHFFLGRSGNDLSRFLRESRNNPHSGLLSLPPGKMPAELIDGFTGYHRSGGRILLLNTISNTVHFSGEEELADIPALNIDEYYGGQLAADHLVRCGVDRIFMVEHPDLAAASTRKKGAADRLAALKRPFEKISFSDIARLSRPRGERWGVLADDDYRALDLYPLCARNGWILGKEIFLCGFDDIFYSRIASPSLTTIHQPTREEGRLALKTLVQMIFGKKAENSFIRPWLCHRESTGGGRPDPEFPEREPKVTELEK